eukprot:46308-Prymnesium_polylepis.1
MSKIGGAFDPKMLSTFVTGAERAARRATTSRPCRAPGGVIHRALPHLFGSPLTRALHTYASLGHIHVHIHVHVHVHVHVHIPCSPCPCPHVPCPRPRVTW